MNVILGLPLIVHLLGWNAIIVTSLNGATDVLHPQEARPSVEQHLELHRWVAGDSFLCTEECVADVLLIMDVLHIDA